MTQIDPILFCEDRKLYEKGLRYLQAQGVITKSRDAWQFFHDRQWEGLERSEVFGKDGPPFINFIKPDVLYKLATVGQRSARMVFLPSETTSEAFLENAKIACEALTAYGVAAWENTKLDSLRWRAVRDAVAKVRGMISTMPERIGLILSYPGHCGVYIGDGNVIECTKSQFKNGVVQTKLTDRKWEKWSQCPYIEYLPNKGRCKTCGRTFGTE